MNQKFGLWQNNFPRMSLCGQMLSIVVHTIEVWHHLKKLPLHFFHYGYIYNQREEGKCKGILNTWTSETSNPNLPCKYKTLRMWSCLVRMELQLIHYCFFHAISRNFYSRTFWGKLFDKKCGCRKVIRFICTVHLWHGFSVGVTSS